MRTKKYLKKHKKSRHTKRRRNGGGWFTNIFKSKSQKAAEQAMAAQQLELDRQREQNIAARPIAETAEKNLVEKQWRKENEEGWETPEELRNKIKRFSSAELANRANNQKAINNFLQNEIAAIQNDLVTCYPNGKTVIDRAKMKDLQDELYTLKEQEKNFRLERKQLKTMFKTTPNCKMQKKMAKEKWQMTSTGEEDMPTTIVEQEPAETFFDTVENISPAGEAANAVDTNTVDTNAVDTNAVVEAAAAAEVEAADANDVDDGEFINTDEYMPGSPRKITSTCDSSYYTPDELNVCKTFNTIKQIITQLIESGNCKDIYLQPQKFYELVKKQVLDALLQGNWLAVRAKMGAITLFLKAYPGIKKTVINTLAETQVFKALCDSLTDNQTVDINNIAETFTNQLINTIINNLIAEYKNNANFSENIQWLQNVYYSYFDKKMMSQFSNMGGKRSKKVSRKRKTVNKRKKIIKRKTRRFK